MLNSPVGVDAKMAKLRSVLWDMGDVVVAFSGGADSAFLAWVANDVLGAARAVAVTAVSPSLAGDEERDCRELARDWALNFKAVATSEMEKAAYLANDPDRCYHCKSELMEVLKPIALELNATVVLGVNVDDLNDHRPGQRAALENGAVFPLVVAEFTKDDIREVSRRLGLRTWNKPAAACLASRIPYGTSVSVGILTRVDRAESALRRMGFNQVRVRHYGDTARVEVPVSEFDNIVNSRDAVVDALKGAGYHYVTLDLEGFRSGNLNDVLRANTASEHASP